MRPRVGAPGRTGVSPKIDANCCFLWDLIAGGSDSINRLATHSQRRPGRTAMVPRRHCNRRSPTPPVAEGTRRQRELDRHIQAKSPPVWIPAFAGMTVVQRCRRSGRAFGRRNDAVSADGRRGRFPRKMSQIAPNCTGPALDGPNGGTGLILIQRTFEADPDGGEARVDAFSGCDPARASGLGVLGDTMDAIVRTGVRFVKRPAESRP